MAEQTGAPGGAGTASGTPSPAGASPAAGTVGRGVGAINLGALRGSGRSRPRILIIEVAVMTLVVGVLLTVGMRAYRSAAGAARATVCIGKLQRLHQMVTMYAQDYDESYPPLPAGETLERATRPFVRGEEAWTVRLTPYRESDKAEARVGNPFVCPAAPDRDTPTYAYNAALGARLFPAYAPESPPFTLAGVVQPTETFLLFDTANEGPANALAGYRFFYGAPKQPPFRPGDFVLPTTGVRDAWMRPRHNDAALVVYCDGHARRVSDMRVRLRPHSPFDPSQTAAPDVRPTDPPTEAAAETPPPRSAP